MSIWVFFVVAVALGFACIAPQWTIYPITDRWHRDRMIFKYGLLHPDDFEFSRDDIDAELLRKTQNRNHDRGFWPSSNDPDWKNDEMHRPNHRNHNHRVSVNHILDLIQKKVGKRTMS